MKNIMLHFFSTKFVLFFFCFTLVQAQIDFSRHTLPNNIGGAQNLITVDLDNDGDLDILASADKMAWWENLGTLNFEPHFISEDCQVSITARPFDLDNDGDLDIISSHYDRKMISFWENDGNQNFTENILLNNFDGAHDVYCGDINNDSMNDVVAVRGDGGGKGEVRLLIQKNKTFSEHTIYSGDFCHSVDLADINDDGYIDIITSHFNTGVRLFINNGDLTFTQKYFTLNLAHFVRAFDFDSDGDKDIICAALSNSVVWWENLDGSNFTKHKVSNNYALFVHAVDVDKDNDYDFVVSDARSQRLKWLENNGSSNFIIHSLPGICPSISGAYSGDIDSDGDMDLLGTTWQGQKKLYLWENQTITGLEKENIEKGMGFKLYQNYPNPFNPNTNITFTISKAERVKISVYDLSGEKVNTLANQLFPAGSHTLSYSGENLSSGVYFYQLETENFIQSKNMVLLK